MPTSSPRHRRLHLSILVATAVLALNAVAVANGWSPFRIPGQATQSDHAATAGTGNPPRAAR